MNSAPPEFVEELSDDSLWVTSYADLISALLAVLVLMASFSKVDIEAFDAVQRARNDETVETLKDMHQRFIKILEANSLTEQVELKLSSEGLDVNFNSVMLFESASSKLNLELLDKEVKPIVSEIAKTGKTRYIDIVGHSDDVPLFANGKSNWNLSSDRAAALHEYMLNLGMPEHGSRLISYAHTQPIMEVESLKGELLKNARELNRRVSVNIGFLKPN